MSTQAAGGVIVQREPTLRVVVVHRPRYDDWSLPKGHLEEGESLEAAAIREAREETGVLVRLAQRLDDVHYRDQHDRAKSVAYWLMEPVEINDHIPDEEVDEIRWVSPDHARRLLTYPSDIGLVEQAVALIG